MLLQYFGSRIQTQISSPATTYQSKINVKMIIARTLHQ